MRAPRAAGGLRPLAAALLGAALLGAALLGAAPASGGPAAAAAQATHPAPPPAQERPPMHGLALANVAISTPDPERLARWYRDVLGFRVASRSPGVDGVRTLIVERDGVALDLITVPGVRPPDPPVDPPRHLETPGLRNLVFWVDDLAAANAHLKARGVALLWEGRYVEGIRTSITAFRDPDGNLVALWARRRPP